MVNEDHNEGPIVHGQRTKTVNEFFTNHFDSLSETLVYYFLKYI